MKKYSSAAIGYVSILVAAFGNIKSVEAKEPLRDNIVLIRQSESKISQVGNIVHILADQYGPRLTASPNNKKATQWAVRQLRAWGFKNAHLEPWIFGHSGWTNLSAEGELVSEKEQPLSFGVAAWTPGTHGLISAKIIRIDPPKNVSAHVLNAYLQSIHSRVTGRIVMIGAPVIMTATSMSGSLDANTIAQIHNEKMVHYDQETSASNKLTNRQRSDLIDAFLVHMKAVARVDDAGRPYGIIGTRANLTFDIAKAVPSVVLRHEDYGRINRLLEDGHDIGLRLNIRNASNPDGRIAYNVVADLPGSEKADEVVMIGAHLDSWHMATGAVDNAVGCAIMMEVGRLIRSLGLNPRRTIRVVLWSGEEEHLLGSQAYVAQHFGTVEQPSRDFKKLAAYINIDGGSGKVRGANIFGPPEAASIIRDIFRQIDDPEIEGAIPHSVRKLGATDATTFSRAGITSIGLIQDPLDYSVAWHGNLDTFERLDEDEAKQAVTTTAALTLALADRDDMPPKFDAKTMPVPIGPAPAIYPVVR
ncbi:M28 family peptidase [Gluconobacter wancherniae]|uniref:M28 family peptidase n=1 Tax=Gluconobacter wancherniae TaxID=1307955 RepID=UPI001B8CDB29|nr:M28 family peptidase [Gluconobacter wancherniae]MBS1095194.1 M20/M25/M40 family metallo-hydrolase [Gluconobacter wancherniae]